MRSCAAATTSCAARSRWRAATRSACASPTGRSEQPLTELSFEDAQKELESIVIRLERGDAGVDELTKLWERGEELYRICATKLEVVHWKIEELRALEERPTSLFPKRLQVLGRAPHVAGQGARVDAVYPEAAEEPEIHA